MADLEAGAYVGISVIDQGAGMDADTPASAAEPFLMSRP